MLNTCITFPAVNPMCWIVNGCSICIRSACCGHRFVPTRPFARFVRLMRHRESLVQMACVHVQHMQKSLDQMNLQIHHVISDITGVTGLAIVDAIVAGNTNPEELAKRRDYRIKASVETVTKSLVRDYREHIFTLKQSLNAYRYYQQLLTDCDREVQQ